MFCLRAAIMLWSVRMTPLGSPVVPDENMMKAACC